MKKILTYNEIDTQLQDTIVWYRNGYHYLEHDAAISYLVPFAQENYEYVSGHVYTSEYKQVKKYSKHSLGQIIDFTDSDLRNYKILQYLTKGDEIIRIPFNCFVSENYISYYVDLHFPDPKAFGFSKNHIPFAFLLKLFHIALEHDIPLDDHINLAKMAKLSE